MALSLAFYLSVEEGTATIHNNVMCQRAQFKRIGVNGMQRANLGSRKQEEVSLGRQCHKALPRQRRRRLSAGQPVATTRPRRPAVQWPKPHRLSGYQLPRRLLRTGGRSASVTNVAEIKPCSTEASKYWFSGPHAPGSQDLPFWLESPQQTHPEGISCGSHTLGVLTKG